MIFDIRTFANPDKAMVGLEGCYCESEKKNPSIVCNYIGRELLMDTRNIPTHH
jgi:hypothetical protein